MLSNTSKGWIILLISIIGLSNTSRAEDKKTPASPVTPPVANVKTHLLAETLGKIGAFSCAERANQIGNFLTGNIQPELVVQIPKDNPNNRLLMSTLILPTQDNQSVIASVALAPSQANGCGGSYHTVYFANGSCAKNIAEKYQNIKFQPINKSSSSIAIVNRALWIIAMPADKGCVFIKEEIVE